MFGRVAFIPELLHRLTCVVHQTSVEFRIGPGAGNDLGPSFRTDAFGVHFDPVVDAFLSDKAFVDQQAFKGLHPKRRVGRQVGVQITVDLFDFLGVKAGHVAMRPRGRGGVKGRVLK